MESENTLLPNLASDTIMESEMEADIQPQFAYDLVREAATETMKRQDFVDALELFMECLNLLGKFEDSDSERLKVCLNISRCLHKNGADELALQFCKKSEKASPSHFKPKLLKGRILHEQSKWGGAISAYKKTLRCLPKNIDNEDEAKIQNRIDYTQKLIESCEKRLEQTQAFDDPNDIDLRLHRLPVRDAVSDMKILFDRDPSWNVESGKPKSNEQPLLHHILSLICKYYDIHTEFASFEPEKSFLFSEDDQMNFLKKLPRLCRERQRVLSELCGMLTINSWNDWTVCIYDGSELLPDHKIIVVFADTEIENIHVVKASDDLSTQINILLRLTIIWGLNSRASCTTAPMTVTICVGEEVVMETITQGMCKSERPEDELDIIFKFEIPEIGVIEGDAGWSTEAPI